MCVEQKDGKIVDFDVDDIHQVYCKEGDAHIDSTSNLLTISGFIDKSVKATSSTDMKSVLSKAVKEINKMLKSNPRTVHYAEHRGIILERHQRTVERNIMEDYVVGKHRYQHNKQCLIYPNVLP